jgi:maltose O-acetyltransferase
VGAKVEFSESLFILNHGNLSIGDGARLGTHCRIYNFSPIAIGANLLASHGLTLISGTHDTETLEDVKGPISIGSDVWIGINVTIVGPTRIGNNVIIGAGSLVIKDVPDNAIVAGVPARLIRIKASDNSKQD